LPLARQLCAQWWGLLPGVHRLVFEEGRVLLTLGISDVKAALREQHFEADAVFLDGFSPPTNPDMWDVYTLKAVARYCRRGTAVASWTVARPVRDALAQCGFIVHKAPGLAPKRDSLRGEFNPHWEPRKSAATPSFAPHAPLQPARCAVIGSGLAGAAVAASLARRGWQVQVLDAAAAPAAGASGLQAGLLAPHVSPDDSLLSRLSRAGVRATLHQAQALLQPGEDWALSGVLEHRVDATRGLPAPWPPAGEDWSEVADAARLRQAGLPVGTAACWHGKAGWIKPARLVQALLAQPSIAWQGQSAVQGLVFQDGQWFALDANGRALAQAELVVIAAGPASRTLLDDDATPLQAIRGQISWGLHADSAADPASPSLPPFPVNGNGSLIPAVPTSAGLAWCLGATFDRDDESTQPTEQDHQANLAGLRTLLPASAQALAPAFFEQPATVQSWVGVRCASRDRLPLVGPPDPAHQPGLVASTAMGSRGLTFAVLCAELLAAQLHGEPLPVESKLAQALRASR
ncbi:MAG TPA: FAD-dependent 5-carboxymethylaminomethyl-2-thiouridine(34) oxidoreductase MnmC, partial [Burkholderiaceae bacterium]|nr:FAD-dependent 5-carboxymethylaminomethyl-2-thiouridine(34) oxidoreductase MnmC [Burkholderiaceae bacterium]